MNPNSPEFRDSVKKLSIKTNINLPILPQRKVYQPMEMQKFLTGLPDADRLILQKMEDIDLFKICSPPVNQYSRKICDETFWQNRVRGKFPFAVNFKPSKLTWKKYYPHLIYYSELLKKEFGFIYKADIPNSGDPKKYLEFLHKPKGYILSYAVSYGFDDLAEFILNKKMGTTFEGALASVHIDNLDKLKYYISISPINLQTLLNIAATNNKINIVKYLVEDLGINNHLEQAMENSYKHPETFYYLRAKFLEKNPTIILPPI
jgi:hypothetical protein